MNLDENEIENLLLKYCEGTASAYEIQKVEAWMNESEENHKKTLQLYQLLLATDSHRIQNNSDMDLVLSHVHKRMDRQCRQFDVTSRSSWNVFLRWAAILFIPMAISLLALLANRTVSSDINMITASTNPGMTCNFYLPDSTLVYLNSNTQLVYPSRFIGKTRNVSLKGEAYFEVKKDADHSFIVSIPNDTKLKVLGTKFNVEAYDGMNEISTTLLEGSVHFIYQQKGRNKYISLEPGEKVVYNTISNSSEVVKSSCKSEMAWKDGKIIFDNTPLKEVLRVLKKRFNVDFLVRNKEYLSYSFTGTFVTQQLDQILMNFNISSKIRWRYLRESPSNQERALVELY